MKKVLINLLSLNGTSIELKKGADETSHFSEASVFLSARGNRFGLKTSGEVFQLQPLLSEVDTEPYCLVGALSADFHASLSKLKKGADKLAICRAIGVVLSAITIKPWTRV